MTRPSTILTEEQVRQIFNADIWELKDVLMFQYYTALKYTELSTITKENVDLEKKIIRLPGRQVEICDAILGYISARYMFTKWGDCLIKLDDKHLVRKTYYRRLVALGEKFGVELSLDTMRATRIAHLLDMGMSKAKIAKLAGIARITKRVRI